MCQSQPGARPMFGLLTQTITWCCCSRKPRSSQIAYHTWCPGFFFVFFPPQETDFTAIISLGTYSDRRHHFCHYHYDFHSSAYLRHECPNTNGLIFSMNILVASWMQTWFKVIKFVCKKPWDASAVENKTTPARSLYSWNEFCFLTIRIDFQLKTQWRHH